MKARRERRADGQDGPGTGRTSGEHPAPRGARDLRRRGVFRGRERNPRGVSGLKQSREAVGTEPAESLRKAESGIRRGMGRPARAKASESSELWRRRGKERPGGTPQANGQAGQEHGGSLKSNPSPGKSGQIPRSISQLAEGLETDERCGGASPTPYGDFRSDDALKGQVSSRAVEHGRRDLGRA